MDIVPDLDLVIASVHQRYKLDEDGMTNRLVTAMRQPFFKIWGHALGRLVLRRDPIKVRIDEIFDAISRVARRDRDQRRSASPRSRSDPRARGGRARHPVRAVDRRALDRESAVPALGRRDGAARADPSPPGAEHAPARRACRAYPSHELIARRAAAADRAVPREEASRSRRDGRGLSRREPRGEPARGAEGHEEDRRRRPSSRRPGAVPARGPCRPSARLTSASCRPTTPACCPTGGCT